MKNLSDPDILEELMEQLFITEECLDKMDREVEEGTKTDDLEDEVTQMLEYKDHTTLRKTKMKRAIRKAQYSAQGDVSVMSCEADPMHHMNVQLPKLVIDKYDGDISEW